MALRKTLPFSGGASFPGVKWNAVSPNPASCEAGGGGGSCEAHTRLFPASHAWQLSESVWWRSRGQLNSATVSCDMKRFFS